MNQLAWLPELKVRDLITWSAKCAVSVIVSSLIAFTTVIAQQSTPIPSKKVGRLSDLMNAKEVAADGVSLQRYVLPPQTQVLRLARGERSAPLKGFCLDQGLPAPGAQKTIYKYVHTRGQPTISVGSGPPITFEEALGARSGIAAVLVANATSSSEGSDCEADGCYYLEFENISSHNLSISFPRALVFGRSEGWLDEQNPREAQLLRILNEPSVSNRKIWEATARLARLRMLGFWPHGVALDAVTSEIQNQAELMAQKTLRIRAEELDRSLKAIFESVTTKKGVPVDQSFPEYGINQAARSRLPYMVRIRATGQGFVRIKGITVSEARIHGSYGQLIAVFNNEVSLLDYSESGYEVELRPQPPGPSGGSGGGIGDGTGGRSGRGSIRVDLNPDDYTSLFKKATAEGCSVEYCVNRPVTAGSTPGKASSGDQQVLFECGMWGFGLSTSGKVEMKVGPLSVETP
jgi:hypothetical protein